MFSSLILALEDTTFDFWANYAHWEYFITKKSFPGSLKDASDPLVVSDPLAVSAFNVSSKV